MSLNSAAEAERQAERLRKDLTGTLDQLVDNLAPSNLAAHAAAAAREKAPDWLKRYWAFAQSPVGLAVIGGVIGLGAAGAMTSRYRASQPRRRRR